MAQNGDEQSSGNLPAPRLRTFLKGVVYYDHRHVSIDCTVREISDSGARITFSTPTTVPDHIELFIPQKDRIFRAQVRRRDAYAIDITFEEQRSDEPRRASDAEMTERVLALETEVAALKRMVKKLRDKILPHDTETT